ncbi:hypothetical protein DRJ17_03170 [Candidatus Woesearchaeota archaeon]|nr:MAG: hypothetical protein DRJ17_03170 [Candidatus Woesearchaeota archaeon]
MASRLAILTLGFDLKFQLRTLSKFSGKIDKVVIVRPEDTSEKSKKAEKELVEFVKEILGLEVNVIKLKVENPGEAIANLYSYLVKETPSSVIADLSGGMRALILEVLASLMNALPLERTKIIIWTENLKTRLEICPRIFALPQLDELSIKILSVLSDGVPRRLKELTINVNAPKTTVFTKLKKLVESGLVYESRERPGIKYMITNTGRIALKIVEAKTK